VIITLTPGLTGKIHLCEKIWFLRSRCAGTKDSTKEKKKKKKKKEKNRFKRMGAHIKETPLKKSAVTKKR
jgi:hypothetical protein